MRKILLSLAVAFGMQADAQNMDSVMFLYNTDNTVDTIPISSLDSITFGYINSFNQGGTGNIILPGNATCDTQYISVTGCGGDTVIIYNGYTYELVEIGGQCWFKENLQTITYRDGTPINYPGTDNTAWFNDSIGAYAWGNNDSVMYASSYGALYNWYAVDNSAGLCPTGWHVPTDCEWMYLEGTLGMSTAEQENTGALRGTDEGNKLKETGTVHWYTNTGATNSSGFTGLPGGVRIGQGPTNHIGEGAYWWSSTQDDTNYNAWYRVLSYNNSYVSRGFSYKEAGYSVRCIKD
tara:strand:+ start:269 stop:1147 length:879 start_codon:yes stop_codon:yes gene_type:complete